MLHMAKKMARTRVGYVPGVWRSEITVAGFLEGFSILINNCNVVCIEIGRCPVVTRLGITGKVSHMDSAETLT